MSYVDGFVLPLSRDQLDAYRRVATQAGAVWREHGALQYVEAVLEDGNAGEMTPYPRLAGCAEGETVVFAWIMYRSRAHRDEVNAKVMADPRMKTMMQDLPVVFDHKRMAYGGFEAIVEA